MKSLSLVAIGLVLLFVPAALAVGTGRDQGPTKTAERGAVLRGINAERLGTMDAPAAALGGNYSNGWSPPATSSLLQLGIYEVNLNDPGTGWQETFIIGVPKKRLFPAPVLVVFHGYGGTPQKVLDKTTYFEEGMARGWIVVAPLSAHQYNFGIRYSQKNTEAVMNWVAKWLKVDVDRFYAVGFSMGGGAAYSYASRHVSPVRARFAGLVNHTGSTSIKDVYYSSANSTLFENDLMFGGSPLEKSFLYSIASTMDLDTFSGTIDQSTDMGRNLSNISVKNFNADGDPNPYLVNETYKVQEQLAARGATSIHTTSTDTIHNWNTLNEAEVLDFFEPLTFTDPGPNKFHRILADRGGRWFSFRVKQTQKGKFTPFRWAALPSMNQIYVDEAENLARLTVNPAHLGLDPSQPLDFVYESVDGQPVELVLRGIDMPLDVKRNGSSTSNWIYDPVKRTVTLFEDTTGSLSKWTIAP
ncbi:MAG: hypothetical protein V3T22_04145 [Planctomycetota bacterium]